MQPISSCSIDFNEMIMKTKVEEIDGKFVATLEGEIIFRQKFKIIL
jgi:hypothetical protein